jgi:hypothetical protein
MQRRLTLGIFIPMAALAIVAIREMASRRFGSKGLFMVVLALSLPSNLMVVGGGLTGVARGDPALTLTASEAAVYNWLEENAAAGSLVLAGPTAGDRIPAYAPVRVVYGHPFETPHAAAARAEISHLYQADARAQDLASLGVAYALYGPEERALGSPAWLRVLPVLFRSDDIEVYGATGP